jgi:hypothetical protein
MWMSQKISTTNIRVAHHHMDNNLLKHCLPYYKIHGLNNPFVLVVSPFFVITPFPHTLISCAFDIAYPTLPLALLHADWSVLPRNTDLTTA